MRLSFLIAATTILFATSVLTSACGPSPDERLGAAASRIVNGTFDEGHPSVGALLSGLGSLCTATLVGARTVLTAGHCVEPGGEHLFVLDHQRWEVLEVVRFPDYSPQVVGEFDVALAILREAPPAQPAAISALAPLRNQEVALVGLGATGQTSGGSGFKRVAKNTIAKISEMTLTYRFASGDVGNLCFGDSGGPSFARINGQDVQVGVHSFISGICGHEGHDMRVDAFRDWIEKTAGGDVQVGGFPDKEAPTVDIVAPTLEDELYGKVSISVSATDKMGVTHINLSVDGKSVGSKSAAPYDFALDLASGEHHLEASAFDAAGNSASGRLTITVLEPAKFGVACTKDVQCASALCFAQPEIEATLCSQSCDPSGDPCPEGAACEKRAAGFICGPPSALLPKSGGCALGGASASGEGGAGFLPIFVLIGLLGSARRRFRSMRDR